MPRMGRAFVSNGQTRDLPLGHQTQTRDATRHFPIVIDGEKSSKGHRCDMSLKHQPLRHQSNTLPTRPQGMSITTHSIELVCPDIS